MEISYDPEQIADLYKRYRQHDLVVDSRRVTRPGSSLFFALPGARTHGVQYVRDAKQRGARDFVVALQDLELARSQVQGWVGEWHPVTFVVCPDPVEVLQALAAYHRQQFDIEVIAITGSNGKTTVKDWLTVLLATKYKVCSSPRSYNSQIGVPLSVWQLNATHEVAVFEAGISQLGEMARLKKIIQPTWGVFTMLGSAHDAGFPDRATKLREKLNLFAGSVKTVVAHSPATDQEPTKLLDELGATIVDWVEPAATVPGMQGGMITIQQKDLPRPYLLNAALAITVATHFEVPDAECERLSRHFYPLRNRLEQTAGKHGAAVINDSYSNDLDALALAIDVARGQSVDGCIHLILGDVQTSLSTTLLGTGGLAPVFLSPDYIDQLVTVGERPLDLPGARHYTSVVALLDDLPNLDFSPLPILVKGASYQRLQRVATALSHKQHRTNLRIDLEAIRHNLRVYRALTEAKLIVMVKASAYGGGSLPIARAVTDAGADYLAVAYTDEGRELRRGGITLPIMVLNPEPEEFAEMGAFDLEPVVGTPATLRLAAQHDLGVHVEVDTGMGRLGFSIKDAMLLVPGPSRPRVLSVFSHLVASEEAAEESFTREQWARLTRVAEFYERTFSQPPWVHLLNSNGISRYPEYALDAVRLGIGLYGIGDARLADRLRPALRLTSRVAAIKDHRVGTTIGYNRRGVLSRPSRIATISIGYADGLPRRAGEGRFSVWINGGLAPTVGSVCMDMTMVDVTDLPDVRVGDEVEIFGPNHSIEVLAGAVGTIGYEILTGVGTRVHRIYVRE